MRKCNKCNTDKELDCFTLRKRKSKSGKISLSYRDLCKDCYNEYHRLYSKNNAIYKDKRTERRRILINKITNDKINQGCFICKYNKCGASLHYHHLDKTTKECNISKLIRNGVTKKETLQKELDKCIVLCANCHGEVEAGLVNVTTP